MSTSVTLGVFSASLFGMSDFSTGLASRSMRVVFATIMTYGFATIVMLVTLVLNGGRWSTSAILWGVVARLISVVGLLAFYAVMATGPMSIASPLIAAIEAMVPVVVALTLGGQLAWWRWLAIAAAIAAGALLPVDHSAATSRICRRTILLAVISGSALGLPVVALNAAPKNGQLIPGVCEVLFGLAVLVVVSAVRH